MNQKFTSTIAGASIFISLLGLASRGLGFSREIIFANNFGLENDFDLYLVGAVIPVTINNIVLFIGQNYFIPGFQKINTKDIRSTQKYFNQSFLLFFLSALLITILLFLLSDMIVNMYMSSAVPANKDLASGIFKIFLITIPFSAGISILSALLQTVYEFKHPAISVLFLNISIISILLIFSDKMGVYSIAVGYVIGTLLQFTYLIFKSKKFISLKIISNKEDFNFSKSLLGSSLLIIILIETISQLYSLFDRYFYGTVTGGGIASLNYGLMIWFLPVSVFSLALATAVFPIMSKAINNSSGDDIERIYNDSISMNTFIFLPITFILFFYGDTLIKIMFERGKFVEASTSMTFGVLKFYSLSLVFYSVYTVFNKIFYSLNEVKLLLSITVAGLMVKLALNILLIDLQQDGLALSTSVSFVFFFCASYFTLNKKLKIRDKSLFFKDILFQSTNSAVCLIAVKITSDLYLRGSIFYEVSEIAIFTTFYVLNVVIVKHKATLISIGVLKRLNLSTLINR